MHYLSEITIRNYRSFISENFPLSQFTGLVGYNNVGKSNLLFAIKWLLRPAALSLTDFNDEKKSIEIDGVVEGIDNELLNQLDDNHRKRIEKYCKEGVFIFRRIQPEPNCSKSDIKLKVWNPNNGNSDEESWVVNPTGIPNAINALFPEPIEIGAMEDATEDVSKSKTSTTIGKLIAEIIEPIEKNYGADLKNSLDGLRKKLEASGTERPTELKQFDEKANSNIKEFFPGINIQLHVPAPEIKEIFKAGTIKVFENDTDQGKDVSTLGHGAQRSIQMALIRYLAEIKSTIKENTRTLLLIDEPELFLHPQAVEYVRLALKKLAKNEYQIVFSTHSPQMIDYDDIGTSLMIRKDVERGTHALTRLNDAIEKIIDERSSQLRTLFEFSNSSQLLFCEQVIITEGKTEQRLLPEVYHLINDKTLNASKIGLISVSGSGNIANSLKIIEAMGIPAYGIVDLDFAFRDAINSRLIDKDNEDIKACKELLQQLPGKYHFNLGDDGLPTSTGGEPPCKGFNILATDIPESKPHIENLHNKLLEHNIWLWKKGTFDDHIGIESKNETAWSNFAIKMKEEKESCIGDIDEIKRCFDCIECN